MAVVSVKILHDGWGASDNAGQKTTFTVVYLVEVDDNNDGPLRVVNASAGGVRIPRQGESYNIGNEWSNNAVVNKKTPTPIDDKFWHVTVNYGPKGGGNNPGMPEGEKVNGLDDDLEPTDDPEEEHVDESVTTVNVTRAAERGAYIGQIDLPVGNSNPWDPGNFDATGFKPGKPSVSLFATGDKFGRITNGVPITNSVFTPFDPPPEISYNQIRITCGFNADGWNTDLLRYVNSINATEILFTGFVVGGIKAAPYTCRFMGVSLSGPRVKNGDIFQRIELEFLIDPLFGWRLDILDRGYCVNANKVSEGAPAKNNIVDAKGNQISEPVLLDGNGDVLDLETQQATYLRYAVYPEIANMGQITDFTTIKQVIKGGL
tara:strand:- start:2566 stop:3690 length:1125 start_codon:yes stop_codon:yes gene_type:complete